MRSGHPARGGALLIAAAIAGTAVPARAWGPEGHRVIGELAAVQLTPAAAAAVGTLLAGEPEPTLAGIANWADETKSPASGPLHYVNITAANCRYRPARDCPDGRCVIAAIAQSVAALDDPAATLDERRTALKNLVHFVGDLHQPLHAGHAEDRGGNTVPLQWQGNDSNLHQLWDGLLIQSIDPDWRHLAARLAPKAGTAAARPSDSRDWARESCAIVADTDFYPASGTPDEAAYRQRWQTTLETRLRRAGQRLAALLNARFKG
ncbi:MAG: endonuclease [Xanthomonadaceae bacterium]|nr:endonuclease [Xanthomonadaceae bacterium]